MKMGGLAGSRACLVQPLRAPPHQPGGLCGSLSWGPPFPAPSPPPTQPPPPQVRPQARQAPRCLPLLPPLPFGLPAAVGTPCLYPGPETNPKPAPSPANPRVRHRMRSPSSRTSLKPRSPYKRSQKPPDYSSLLSLLTQKSEDSPKSSLKTLKSPGSSTSATWLCLATPGFPLVAGHTLPPLTPAQPLSLHALAPAQGQLLPG